MTSARQTLSITLAGLRDYLGSQPKSKQMTSYERGLDRVLNACEDEPLGVRRYVGLLKRRAWWV
jgi:hypothetical protein